MHDICTIQESMYESLQEFMNNFHAQEIPKKFPLQ